MKKILTFVPLGVGISGAIIYILNIMNFRIINNSVSMFKILYNLRIYLYISIFGFIVYFFIRLLSLINKKEKVLLSNNYKQKKSYNEIDESKLNKNEYNDTGMYVPNYDYVPLYNKSKNYNKEKINSDDFLINEARCIKCGNKILNTDRYCYNCGTFQDGSKKIVNPIIKNIINIIEIVILILIIYFSLNLLFNYKEKIDNNFKSPFKINMTK